MKSFRSTLAALLVGLLLPTFVMAQAFNGQVDKAPNLTLSKMLGVDSSGRVGLTPSTTFVPSTALPAGPLVGTTDAQTLTNKTLASPTISGILTSQAISMSAEPSQVYNWAGVPTYVADLRLHPGSMAGSPEIARVTVMQSTGGNSDPTRNFKMVDGRICVVNPGGASCWGDNIVIDMLAGIGSSGGIGSEIDFINQSKDFTSVTDNPLATALYLTGQSGGAFYADSAITITGAGPTWTDGIQASQFSAGAGTTTISIASPATFTRTAHGFIANQPVVFTTTGALPTGLVAGTRYYVVGSSITANTFQVSTAPSGSALTTTGTQSGVHSSAGGNVFKRSFINDASNSPVSYLISGNHNIGINMTGCNCAQYQIVGNNFTIDPTGDIAGVVLTATSSLALDNALLVRGTPVIATGFGTSPSIVSNNGVGTFRINVGTGGSASSGSVTLPTAAAGWNCIANDVTTSSATVFATKQTASTTTSVTLTNYNTSGAAAAWAASDILAVSCSAY